jgi:hypothetical protein
VSDDLRPLGVSFRIDLTRSVGCLPNIFDQIKRQFLCDTGHLLLRDRILTVRLVLIIVRVATGWLQIGSIGRYLPRFMHASVNEPERCTMSTFKPYITQK